MQATTTPKYTTEQVTEAVNAILSVLGEPTTEAQAQALTAFRAGDHQAVKILSAISLTDSYLKALNYLPGAFKLTDNTPTILAEAARAAADANKEQALARLSAQLSNTLGTLL
jgi:hypothetical protein